VVLVDVFPIEVTMLGVDHDLTEIKSNRPLSNHGRTEGHLETIKGFARGDFG
jgi:hypothetical protein